MGTKAFERLVSGEEGAKVSEITESVWGRVFGGERLGESVWGSVWGWCLGEAVRRGASSHIGHIGHIGRLGIVVHTEFVRVGTQSERCKLILSLRVDPTGQAIFCKHIAAQQKIAILLQSL